MNTDRDIKIAVTSPQAVDRNLSSPHSTCCRIPKIDISSHNIAILIYSVLRTLTRLY